MSSVRSDHHVPPETTPAGSPSFVPCLRVRKDIWLCSALDRAPGERETEVAVLDLSFDYLGQKVGARNRRRLTRPDPTRDDVAERQASALLESLGVVEVACLGGEGTLLGSDADYLVHLDGDPHAICTFLAHGLPRLQALGWHIEIAPEVSWKVVADNAPWYAQVDAARGDAGKSDWFNLELGIEIDGQRVNLLPALLAVLEGVPPAARIESLFPSGGRSFALAMGDGRYLLVPPDRLRILIKVLRELYDEDPNHGGFVRFPGAKAASLAQLDQAFAPERRELLWRGATAVRERGQALLTRRAVAPAPPALPPPGLLATLRPYQEEGLAFLQHLRAHGAGGVLADDMGLGKTLQAIAHLVVEKAAGRMGDPALVVAPTSLMGTWRREIQRFAPHLKVATLTGPDRRRLWKGYRQFDVLLITYACLVRDQDWLDERTFYLLILDEAQAIKNARSQCRQAVVAVKAQHRLCLSGTPLENHLGELWSLFDFLMPGLLGDASWFRHRFAVPIEQGGDEERLRQLRDQVAPFILRRLKEEVARDLPPKTEIIRAVELTGDQRDLYEGLRVAAHGEVRRAIAKKGIGASTITILDALMKLRQVCCDPRLLAGETAREVRESAKYDLFMELLQQQLEQRRRVLVFSQFTSMLALLAQGLRDKGIPHQTLTGSTANRQEPIDAFERGQSDVFLISLKAGGTGINLTSADTVIHYDPWWNPAAQAQATDRAHRIGQTKPVFVYKLIVAGGVEEQMMRLQRRKQLLADGVLTPAAPGGARLSEQDLENLFSPLGGES